MSMTVYISGPISGIANRNAFAFDDAAIGIKTEFLGLCCCEVINPVLIGEQVDKSFAGAGRVLAVDAQPGWQDYMRACIRELTRATHIYMLPGWEKSRGATVEKELAEKLGIKVCYSLGDLRKSCRDSAADGYWEAGK